MRNTKIAKLFTWYAKKWLGVHYNYGTTESRGDDPVGGFDCSGLVTECLRAIGYLHNSDRFNAQGIYNLYAGRDDTRMTIRGAKTGCLAFYGKSTTQISHIGIMLDDKHLLEAGGGASTTHDKKDSAIRNAFVRIRPYWYRADFVCFIDIFT